MPEPQTSLTLLGSLRDGGDAGAWQRFDATYRPVLMAFGCELGLSEHDADEAAQRTVIQFRESYLRGNYDRDRGRFRNWLFGIAKHAVGDLYAERARHPIPTSQRTELELAFSLMRDDVSLSAVWDRQWDRHIMGLCLQRAAGQFSARDLRIFEMLTVDDRPVQEVAEVVRITRAAVYKVKHRVLAFLTAARMEFEASA